MGVAGALHGSVRAAGPICALLLAIYMACNLQRLLCWLEHPQAVVTHLFVAYSVQSGHSV